MVERKGRAVIQLLALLSAEPAFVGCESFGHRFEPAPKRPVAKVQVAIKPAAALAWYEMYDGLGVLAPIHWKCQATIGSSGTMIIVSPGPVPSWQHGPFITIGWRTRMTGSGTSAIIQAMIDLLPPGHPFLLEAGPSLYYHLNLPDRRRWDQVQERSPVAFVYTTPPWRTGLGTKTGAIPDANPILGSVIFQENTNAPEALFLQVRLPARAQSALSSVIIDDHLRRGQSFFTRLQK